MIKGAIHAAMRRHSEVYFQRRPLTLVDDTYRAVSVKDVKDAETNL